MNGSCEGNLKEKIMSWIGCVVKKSWIGAKVATRTLLAGSLVWAAAAQPASAQSAAFSQEDGPRHSVLVVLDEEAVGLSPEGSVDRGRTLAFTRRLTRDVTVQAGVCARATLAISACSSSTRRRDRLRGWRSCPGSRSSKRT